MSFRTLVEPVRTNRAILGFSGRPDAGTTVSRVISELEAVLPCEPTAILDMDGYWCTESTRPEVLVQHGQIRRLDWPEYRFSLCSPPLSQPFLIGVGPEPAIRWRAFIHEIFAILGQWDCRELTLLGSFHDQVFHDEAVFSGVVQDAESFNRIRELGCEQFEYEGPGAIHSAIMEASADAGIRCTGLWSHFPFYLNSTHELLAARLLDMVGGLLGMEFDTTRLLASWHKKEKDIEDLIHSDRELRRLLEGMKRPEPLSGPVPRSRNVLRLDEFLKKRKE